MMFEHTVKCALPKVPFTPSSTPNLCQLQVDEVMYMTTVWVLNSQISMAKGELTMQ